MYVCMYVGVHVCMYLCCTPLTQSRTLKSLASKAGQVQISEETLRDQLTKQCEATAAVSFGHYRV